MPSRRTCTCAAGRRRDGVHAVQRVVPFGQAQSQGPDKRVDDLNTVLCKHLLVRWACRHCGISGMPCAPVLIPGVKSRGQKVNFRTPTAPGAGPGAVWPQRPDVKPPFGRRQTTFSTSGTARSRGFTGRSGATCTSSSPSRRGRQLGPTCRAATSPWAGRSTAPRARRTPCRG